MNLGKQIRHLRQLREYSQEYLGHATGIGQRGISRIENDEVSPSYCQLQQIARVLHVELSFLLEFNTNNLLNMLHMRHIDKNKNGEGICNGCVYNDVQQRGNGSNGVTGKINNLMASSNTATRKL